MKIFFRILLGFLILFTGIKAVSSEFEAYTLGLFSEFQYFPFAFLILFTIVALILDISSFRVDKKLLQLSVSFAGILFCSFVVFKIIQRNSIDNSKNILIVSNKPGASNVLTFEFKEKGHFRLTEYFSFGGHVYYGKYSKSGDSIKIIKSNYHGFLRNFPKKGFMKADTFYWNNSDTMLLEKE